MNTAKTPARPTRKSAELPTHTMKKDMAKTLTGSMMAESEETQTSLTTMIDPSNDDKLEYCEDVKPSKGRG